MMISMPDIESWNELIIWSIDKYRDLKNDYDALQEEVNKYKKMLSMDVESSVRENSV